jgi:hypothetical protein
MTSVRHVLPSVLVIALCLAHPIAAQSPAPKATAAPKEDSAVTEKGFAGRVFEIRHRDPRELGQAIHPLMSGYRGSTIEASREFKTITVRDFPENIAAIEAALKRLDVAEAVRADVELRLWVLVASGGEAAAGRFPEDLKEVVAALKSTLAYKNYALAGTFVQRVRDGARGIRGEGVTDIAEPIDGKGVKGPMTHMQLEFAINALALDSAAGGPASVKLDGFSFSLMGNGRAQLKTDMTLRDGEKVVVGTSTVQDRGLVVVVSARVIR